MTDEATTYEFGPIERRGLFGMLRPGQVAMLGVAALSSVGMLYVIPTFAGAGLAVLVTAVALGAAFVPLAEQRTLEQWAGPWLRHQWRERTGINQEYGLGAALGVRRGERIAGVAQPAVLAGIEWLSFPLEGRTVGVAKDTTRGGYTSVLRIWGPSFMLLDPAAQEALLDQFGRVLAMQALEGSSVTRIQLLERTVPDYGNDLRAYFDEIRDPALSDADPIVDSYEELLEGASPASQQHEALLAIQVDGGAGGLAGAVGPVRIAGFVGGLVGVGVLALFSIPAAVVAFVALGLAMARAVGGAVRDGLEVDRRACETMKREVGDLRRALHQNTTITVQQILGPRSFAWLMRSAFDPAIGEERRAREGEDPGVAGANAWPLSSEVDKRWWRTDSGLHRTWKIEEWPRRPVNSDWLHPLILGSGVRRTFSVVMRPIPAILAIREAEQAVSSEEAEADRRGKAGFRSTARHGRQYGSASRREDELVGGHADYEFAGFISVTVPSGPGDQEALATASSQVNREAAQCLMDTRVMYGYQDEGFTNTLPLCRGLR